MANSELLCLVPNLPRAVRDVLDGSGAPLEPPIRSEIFGPPRFAQHGRSLGETHRAALPGRGTTSFFPRLRSNLRTLRQSHAYIAQQATAGCGLEPAARWLLDNFHLVETQLRQIREGLPRSYFRGLPVLQDEPLAGLPRIYGVAWAFVAHTDGAFDSELLVQFLSAYQETRELHLSEIWALPTALRVVLVENLRRLGERVAASHAARELANLCCDDLSVYSVATLDRLRAVLDRRGAATAFLAQIAVRLHALRSDPTGATVASVAMNRFTWHHNWLSIVLPDLAAVQAQQAADQQADNRSVSHALVALRSIGAVDWTEIVARSSSLMRVLLGDAVFSAEDQATRDQTLHAIERLARRGGRSELSVANTLLDLMRSAPTPEDIVNPLVNAVASPGVRLGTLASHWLHGAGRPALLRALGLQERAAVVLRALARHSALPLYLTGLLLGTAGLVAWMLLPPGSLPGGTGAAAAAPLWPRLIAAALMLFPASETVIAIMNRLISESARPRHLPRLDLADGIPPGHRVLVVIPALLNDAAATRDLVHRLHLHYLANPERQAQFALLTDWADAKAARAPSDQALLRGAAQQIRELNDLHPMPADAQQCASAVAARFVVLHRERRYSATEQCWIGWERKRGKLEVLIDALAQGSSSVFLDLGDASRIAPDVRYVVTLDSDTQLPPGRLRELVGIAAHPHNRPQVDAVTRTVLRGYAILQPRVVTPLPAANERTLFHWMFAGQCGIDPYSAATSEIYQDLFSEGSFTGKGLLDVHAMHAVLSGRLPQGRILSHDLLEGALARCAAVTDITLIEDAPFHADVAAARVHRWTRGDWQLLPILRHPARYPLRAVNRWKMLDNLRRSLVAPASLALLLLVLASGVVAPAAALALVAAAFSAGPLIGAVAGFAPSRDDLAKRYFYRQAALDLARAALGGLWHLLQLLQHARLAADAIGRTLYRMSISHRHLLQWTTAAAAQAATSSEFGAVMRRHWRLPLVALLLLGGLLGAATATPCLASTLCLLWAASPLATWWASRPRAARDSAALTARDRTYLAGAARDTWRYFERMVGDAENHLPPDNLQTAPDTMVAHRTSPTNIGLYLLSVACARQFGWLGTEDLLARIEATLATLATLPRHRGHFFNWYDTQTRAPLQPMYVSTVDSGNLSAHLIALAQACRELARAPHDLGAVRQAIKQSQRRLAPLLAPSPGGAPPLPQPLPNLRAGSALAQLLALPDPLAEGVSDPARFDDQLRAAAAELAAHWPRAATQEGPAAPAPNVALAWLLADHLATLRSGWQDAASTVADPAAASGAAASRRLLALARACEELAFEADFSFLYDRQRHLFHLGYRVAEQQLDDGLYDLLASEARLTSLVAIAKGDVPLRHWAALGRPLYAFGSRLGLRSWSGSMFEYLMPSLVLDEPRGSVLDAACRTALHEQIRFASAHGVPWGISESAYALTDDSRAYQYAPQGVPRLALRRTPRDELVVAPYATALAAQIAPHWARINLAALQRLGARARHGFIEALDFSPARQGAGEAFTPVQTFMSHHQGMSIVALANVLLDGPARRWGMANARIAAIASLLHERPPRELSLQHAPAPHPAPDAVTRCAARAPGGPGAADIGADMGADAGIAVGHCPTPRAAIARHAPAPPVPMLGAQLNLEEQP